MPRFSANLHFLFGERPFLERFGAAAGAGFQAVEFPDPYSYPWEELAGQLRQHSLQCVLLNFPMGDRKNGDMGLACHPGRLEEFRASVPMAIETARRLGCPRLNCMAGRRPEGMADAKLYATLIENLTVAARACADAGLELTLEPLNSIDYADIFVSRAQQALDIIRAVGAPNLALQFDCYHMQLMEASLPETLARCLPMIRHIQIGDVPGRHEPGSGTIDYPNLFALLDRLGYDGWVGAEYIPSGRTEETLGWLADSGHR